MRHHRTYVLVFLALASLGLQGDRKNGNGLLWMSKPFSAASVGTCPEGTRRVPRPPRAKVTHYLKNNNPHFIQVLNHHSRPVVGEEWTVQFITNGSGELVIENHNPDEVEFVGLECESVIVMGGRGMITSREVKGLKQEGSRTTLDWHYGMGRAIFRPLKPGKHEVELAFGGSEDTAFNQATEVVSTESTNISQESAIAVDSANIYIAWRDQTDYGGSGADLDIFFKSKPIGGSWPATTEVVSTESTETSFDPVIAVDSANIYIAWRDSTNYGGSGTDWDIFFKSKSIGGSWPATTEVVSTESTANSFLPTIAVDSTNVYIAWDDWTDYLGAGTDEDIFFKSKPIGGSWPAATEIVSTESTDDSSSPTITVDSTNVYIAWYDITDYGGAGTDDDIFFKAKPIGGSWPATTEIASTESTTFSWNPDIAVDSTSVYIAWRDYTPYGGSGADPDIFFKSKPIGGSWPATTEVVSTGSTSDSWGPTIAVDSTKVCITWRDNTDYGGSGTDKDIFFKSKVIGGSWPAATEIVSTESIDDSFGPTIAVDSTNVYIAWHDYTDYLGAGTDLDIFFKKRVLNPTPASTLTPIPPDEEFLFINKNIFNPGVGETVEIQWAAFGPGQVTLVVYNTAGELVRRLVERGINTAGVSGTEEWDGHNDKGDLVASGVYIVYLQGRRSFLGKVAVVK